MKPKEVKLTFTEYADFQRENLPFLQKNETPITNKIRSAGVFPDYTLQVRISGTDRCVYLSNR